MSNLSTVIINSIPVYRPGDCHAISGRAPLHYASGTGLSQHEYRGKDGQIVSDQNVTRERCQGGYGLQESLAFLLSTCSEILATLESSLLPAPTPEASIRLMSHKSMVSIMSESHYRRSLASTTPVIGTLSIVRRDTHLEKAPTPSNHDLSPQYVFFWTEARR